MITDRQSKSRINYALALIVPDNKSTARDKFVTKQMECRVRLGKEERKAKSSRSVLRLI